MKTGSLHRHLFAVLAIAAAAQMPTVTAEAQTFSRTKATPSARHRINPSTPGQAFVPGRRIAAPTGRIVGTAPIRMNARPGNSVMKAPAKPVGLKGSVIFAGKNETPLGVYAFNPDGTGTLLAEGVLATYGGVAAHGSYYLNSEVETWIGTALYHQTWSMADWQQLNDIRFYDEQDIANDMAYDPRTDRAYGSFYTGDGQPVFGWLDLQTFEVTRVGEPLEASITGIAISPEGTVYAIDVTGALSTVDPLTGKLTFVGDTGLRTQFSTSAVWDTANSRILYGLQTSYDSSLYAVDPATGASQWVLDFDDSYQVTGMWIDSAEDNAAAPAQATGVSLTPLGGRLSATFAFTAPAATVGGAAIDGNLSYEILLDNQPLKSGTIAAGADFAADLSVSAAGRHIASVAFTKGDARGPVASASAYIGTGAPLAPTGCKAALDISTGTVTITWEPVAGNAANGGFVDPDATTYTVIRTEDGKKVAEDISATECTDQIEIPNDRLVSYTYSVQPTFDGLKGETAISNAISAGAHAAPYTETFDNASALATFTIIEGEAAYTPNTWKYMNGAANGRCGAWLITPAIYLEAGKTYNFSCKVKGQYAYYDEALEAFLGTAPTVEAMTVELFKTGTFRSASFKSYGSAITVDNTGLYYIGFHNASPSFSMSIYVDDVTISSGFFAQTPQACTDMKVSPYADGTGNAVIFAKAPSKTASDATLRTITKVDLMRDGKYIKSFTAAKPGQTFSLTDTGIEPGEHTWSLVAWNGDYEGFSCEATAFVGINVPVAPASAAVEKTGNAGEVKISWTPVTVDIAGQELLPDKVTYAISDGNEVVGYGLKGDSYTFKAVADGAQDYVQYGVFAMTDGGVSAKAATTGVLLVGAPAPLPWREGVDGGELHNSYIVGAGSSNYAQWGIMTPEATGFADADNSGGMLAMVSRYRNEESTIVGPAIALGDAANPVLSLQYYCQEEGVTNQIMLYVRDADIEGSQLEQTGEAVTYDTASPGWHRAVFDLGAWRGKNIIFGIKAVVKSHMTTIFDDIRVYDRPAMNLRALYLSVPATVTAGDKVAATVAVENNGTSACGGYSVEILDGEEVLASDKGSAIEPDATALHNVTLTFGVAEATERTLKARVIWADDADASDNVTAPVRLTLRMPEHPVATDLRASQQGEDVVLEWERPVIPGENEPKTSDFEIAAPWATDTADGWTMIDLDGKPSGGIQGIELPGVENQPVSFFVLDTSDERFNDAFTPHSGTRCMASMFVNDEKVTRSQDWMISPELNGEAQTLTLWAKSFSASYPETFDIFVSDGSDNPADFRRVAEFRNINAEWTQYSAEVPSGARRVAIRCSSDDAFMLMVDDITFTPLFSPIELTGYRVYADGRLVHEGTEPSFTHEGAASGGHTYVVTAVYDRGESAPSNAVSIDYSGLESIGAAKAIYAVDRGIVIRGFAGERAVVSGVDGRTIWSGTPSADVVSVGCLPGIYLVKAGQTSAKVAVR